MGVLLMKCKTPVTGSPRGYIVVEVGILVCRSTDALAFGFRAVASQCFLHVPVDRSCPILIIIWESRVIRLLHSDPDTSLAESNQVSTNPPGVWPCVLLLVQPGNLTWS